MRHPESGVALGVDVPIPCDNPEHKWDIKLSLARDFEPRLITFEKNIAAGAGTVLWGEKEGPRQGFSWLITRLYAVTLPILSAGTLSGLTQQADVVFLPVKANALRSGNTAPTAPFGGTGEIFDVMTMSSIVGGLFAAKNYRKESIILKAPDYLGCIINLSAAMNGQTFGIGGQAIEVPDARVVDVIS